MIFDIAYHETEPKIIIARGLGDSDLSLVADLRRLEQRIPATYEILVRERNSFLFDDSMYSRKEGFFCYDAENQLFYFENNKRWDFDKASVLAFALAEDKLSLGDGEIILAKHTLREISRGQRGLNFARGMGHPVECSNIYEIQKQARETYRRDPISLEQVG